MFFFQTMFIPIQKKALSLGLINVLKTLTMANRRKIKKQINLICGELFAEVVAMTLYTPNINKQIADDVMTSILKLQDEMLRRVSHTQPGNVKGFYKKLCADMDSHVDEIFDQIANL